MKLITFSTIAQQILLLLLAPRRAKTSSLLPFGLLALLCAYYYYHVLQNLLPSALAATKKGIVDAYLCLPGTSKDICRVSQATQLLLTAATSCSLCFCTFIVPLEDWCTLGNDKRANLLQ